ncbi:MAG: ParB/RepB/Spo0J family partition protein [Alphaproteobacteria bacterium]|nr:MAG: ParB/RepB/Spo0J family partition protein [Alphaproteobacteria bacterium]
MSGQSSQMKKKKRGGLGRGLDALFQDGASDYADFAAALVEDADEVELSGSVENAARKSGVKIQELPVVALVPGKYQPRRHFADEKMKQLVESVKIHGVLQPLLVRPLEGGSYEIVAGERRWRAAQEAQLHKLPVVIKEIDDRTALEIALIENLQRQDLNPVEEAEGYQRLIEEFSYRQEDLAGQLGKSRSHVANTLRLLKLPAAVADYLREGLLSAGHARAILGAPNMKELADIVVKQGLSVRETERRVAGGAISKTAKKAAAKPEKKSIDLIALEDKLTGQLGLKVTIDPENGHPERGTITIAYRDLDQLDGLLRKFSA